MFSPAWLEQFEHFYIDERSRDSFVAQRLQSLLPESKFSFVGEAPLQKVRGTLTAEQFSRSKKLVYVKPFEGQFFRRCPGATQKKTLTCCNYYVLNLGQQCNMNCSYCYLQSYINTPYMMIYSNIEQALLELDEMAALHSELPYRVGTGEVIDSLSMDGLTLYSRELIAFFKKYPKWILEFKTKSAQVDQFLDCDHAGNVVVSWSVNTEFITRSEEHGTADLGQRLAAARKCADRGFKVAFHIDPLIHYPGWEEGYKDLCQRIDRLFKPEEVHIMSLGTLRFQPEQRHMMRERFGLGSQVTRAEMFTSDGGKLRYDSEVRKKMYQHVIHCFGDLNPKWKIFLCMETPETWLGSLEHRPMEIAELKEFFRPLPKIKSENLENQ
jgi:spore photoproduct lyase